MIRNSEISFLVDSLIVETLLCDTSLQKTGQLAIDIRGLIDKVKDYVSRQIDPNDKVGSLINILAPGMLAGAFKTMGFGWLGFLFGLCIRIFHIDVASILRSIWDKLKETLHSKKEISSGEINGIVEGAVQEHTQPTSDEDISVVQKMLGTQSLDLLYEARILKLAMIEFKYNAFKKEGQANLRSMYSSKKVATASLLSRVLSWVFSVAVASAGLMVAGDLVNKFVGRPNALDSSFQQGKGETVPATAPMHVATQTKFKLQPGYHDEIRNVKGSPWVENVPNNKSSIASMVVGFAKQVYAGLDNLDTIIESTPGFQVIVSRIAFFNHTSEGDNMVYIPQYFTSKKQMVDLFIDDVAEKAA